MQDFSNHEGIIYLDGKMLPWKEAKLHVLSHGLHYASSVFEGERSYGGKVFKEIEHTNRLHHSAKVLGFDIPYTVEEICSIRRKVLEANSITDGYIRPVAWRGSEMMGISAQETSIHFSVSAWEWPSYFSKEAKLRGIRLKISDWKRPSPETAPIDTKAAGLYMICTLSKHQAESEGYEDSLMLDYRGLIAEATGANIFFVINNELHTPIPDCFLNGITRKTVIDIAKNLNVNVVERYMKPEEMEKAEECFVTGTAAEVTPVREIGKYKFKPGKMCNLMIEEYTKLTQGIA